MNARVVDMTGKRYSSLVAIQICGKSASGDLKWLFRCDCGIEFKANGYYARTGKIINCPTCAKERTRAASLIHGKSSTNEFEIWTGIHTRCYNKKAKAFKNYGGRGIVMCDRWRDSFENFLADMGKRPSPNHSLDRYPNNDGNYEPGNCRWATDAEQGNNKRNNVKVTIGGVTKNMTEWAREYGVQVGTASLRHRQGLRGEALFKTSKLTIAHNGITDTVRGWSDRTGIKPSTISMRISKQWPVGKALTQGASK